MVIRYAVLCILGCAWLAADADVTGVKAEACEVVLLQGDGVKPLHSYVEYFE